MRRSLLLYFALAAPALAANPNASGPPFVDGQPLPAAGLNHAFSGLGGALSGSFPNPQITTVGSGGSITVDTGLPSPTQRCWHYNSAGFVTSITNGSC